MVRKSCRSLFVSLTALVLSVALLLPNLTLGVQAAPSDREMSMQLAVTLAIQSSKELTAQKNKILLKKMKYVEAVKGIKLKIKDLRTFRWTPLFGFKFPKPLDLVNEFDMTIKPTVLQADIDKLVHQMDDVRRTVVEKTATWFLTAYQLQCAVNFAQTNLDDATRQNNRVQTQLKAGEATQTDADRAQARVENLKLQLSNLLRDQTKAEMKLSELTGVDVTVDCIFRNPFQVARIPREELPNLIQSTLDKNHMFFEARTTESTSLLTMNAYDALMKNQYGSKMDPIRNFINMSRQGMEVDSAAFQLAYNEMLKQLDRPWDGYFWILFFRFSKELLKGPISGTRYIQDEMYAIFTACMEYAAARKEREAMEKDLTDQVKDMFDTVVTTYNAYLALEQSVDRNREELERLKQLNQQGKATFEEVADSQAAYQESQQDMLDTLCEYNKLIVQFDRLTCGAVFVYLNGEELGLDTGEGGDAFAILDPILEPYYYIYDSVSDLTFNIGVSIPDGFKPDIDSFEIWYEGTQIGNRTQVGEELRHLTLDYGDSNALVIRLYSGDNYVDECEISTVVRRDVLDIGVEKPPEKKPRVLGSYRMRGVLDAKVSTVALTLIPNATEEVVAYSLSYDSSTILTPEKQPIEEPFNYLTLMIPALNDVEITLYKKDDSTITAYFDTFNLQLVDLKPTSEPQT